MTYINYYFEAETTLEDCFYYDDCTSLDEVNLDFWFDEANYKFEDKKTFKGFLKKHAMTIISVFAILLAATIKIIVKYC